MPALYGRQDARLYCEAVTTENAENPARRSRNQTHLENPANTKIAKPAKKFDWGMLRSSGPLRSSVQTTSQKIFLKIHDFHLLHYKGRQTLTR